MKNLISRLSASFVMACCICACLQARPLPAVTAPAQADDSVTVYVKFVSPCFIPEKIKVWNFNIWSYYNNGLFLPVNPDGTVTYRAAVNEAQQLFIYIYPDMGALDFMATPKEKTYHVEITCNNNRQFGSGAKLEVRDSYENQAYSQFKDLQKVVTDSIDSLKAAPTVNLDMANKNVFESVRRIFLEYQKKVAALAKAYPNSYTARVLCPAEILPESTFSSVRELRENYLKREAFTNPQLYTSGFVPYWLVTNFFNFLNENDTTFTGFDKALDIAAKDQDAGKILEQALYSSIFHRNKEAHLRGYINWAKRNPDKMYNQVVQYQLKQLENCIAGAHFIDIELNDPNGNSKKLSETVAASKLTLLIFYSPECPHCREHLPKIVNFWNENKDKGFNVYTVGFASSYDEWIDFIQTKGTGVWTNVFADDKHIGAASGKYMTTGTPFFVLIDGRGIIYARPENMEYMEGDVEKYFKDKKQ